jgi:DNA-binding transcriptional MerR regulator
MANFTSVINAPRSKAPPPVAKGVAKSSGAYRTITEVAADLGVATHVLRFWESKFEAVKPLKKSGSRRYYNPDDVALLKLIQSLLYSQGYSVRGVQTYLQKSTKKDIKTASAPFVFSPTAVVAELTEIRKILAGD